MEVYSDSPRKTQKIAQELTSTLKGGEIIALFGDLGTGKTVFIKGLAKSLKIKKPITSPTFVFMKIYKALAGQKPVTFYHIDLYRLSESGKVQNFDLDEIFSQDSIVAIEWAKNLGHNLPKKRIDVTIELENETKRKIKIERRV